MARLQARLELGPAAAGYGEDQRWTLVRVVALIATMSHLRVGITTAWQTMRRLGYTPQLPIHRAVERDEAAIAHWRRYQWPAVKQSPRARAPGSSSRTSVARAEGAQGHHLGTERRNTGGEGDRQGHGAGVGRRAVLPSARRPLPADLPHPALSAIAARCWLLVYQLPAYAPELNPVEKVWSTRKGSLANRAARTAGELAAAVKNRLKRMQYRTRLIDGYLTGTGLSPPLPTRP